MSFLGGLGAVAGGVGQGLEEGYDIQQKRLQRSAQDALGKAFGGADALAAGGGQNTGLSGLGGMPSPGQQPQQMSPGQPSQPMQQPQPANQNTSVQSAPNPPMGGGPQATPQMMNATAGQESGGDYGTVGKAVTDAQGNHGNAIGKYGIMSYNVPQWTKEVLGQSMSPEQFRQNPQAQDAVYKAKMGALVQKYGVEGAGRAWLGGEGSVNNPGAKDALGTSVGSYGKAFADSAGPGGQPAGGGAPQQGQPQQSPGSDSLQQMAQRISKANPGIKPAVLWQAMATAFPMMNAQEKTAFAEQSKLYDQQLKGQAQQIKVLQDQIKTTLQQGNLDERKAHDSAMEGQTAARTNAEVQRTQQQMQAAQQRAEDARKKAIASSSKADFQKHMQAYSSAQKAMIAAETNLRSLQAGGRPEGMSTGDYTKELQGASGEADAARKTLGGMKPPSPDDDSAGPRNEDAPPRQPSAAPAASDQPVKVQTAADYAKVPPGAQYMDPQGNIRTKPGAAGPGA